MPIFEVYTECPFHEKLVILEVKAGNPEEAERKVLGMRVICPWGTYQVKRRVARVRFLKPYREAIFEFKAGREYFVPPTLAEELKTKGVVEVLGIEERVFDEPCSFIVRRVIGAREKGAAIREKTITFPKGTVVREWGKKGIPTSVVPPPEIVAVAPAYHEALYVMPGRVAEELSRRMDWDRAYKSLAERFNLELRRSLTEHTVKRRLRELAREVERARERYVELMKRYYETGDEKFKNEAEELKVLTRQRIWDELDRLAKEIAEKKFNTIWTVPLREFEEYKRLFWLLEGSWD